MTTMGIYTQMLQEKEEYISKYLPTHIDNGVCPNDHNIQIYPVNVPRRKEYSDIDFLDTEPKNGKKKKKRKLKLGIFD